jgi:cytoskeletal protein CcmA (bactofilin family)
MAMIAALVCLIVIVALTTVAVQQSLGSLSSTGQVRKLLQTNDAASAGLQNEINAVRAAASAPQGQQLSCPNGPQRVTLTQSGSGQPDVADPASTASYSLSVSVGLTPPSTAAPCLLAGLKVPVWVAGSPWYALIQSRGTTSSSVGGLTTGRTLQTLVQVDPSSVIPAVSTTTTTTAPVTTTLVPTYGPLATYPFALFGQQGIDTGSNFTLTDPTGNVSANTFSGGTSGSPPSALSCTNAASYQGSVTAYAPSGYTGTSVANGACVIQGSLYVKGNLVLSNGASVTGNIYAAGTVDLTGAFNVSGSIHADGAVTLENGVTVNNSVYADGPVTMSGNAHVGANVYATGAVTMSGSASVAGTIEASGADATGTGGNITYSGTAHSGPAYVTAGYSVNISPCPKSGVGPTSCPSPFPVFPDITNFPTLATLPPTPVFPAYTYVDSAWQSAGYQTITNDSCDAGGLATAPIYNAITNAAAGTHATVVRTHCQIVWSSTFPAPTSLRSNLAIIADRGVQSASSGGIGSLDGITHDFFLIVPTATDSGVSNVSGAVCVDFSAPDNVGNVVPGGNFNSPATVHTFISTPNSVCMRGATNIFGKVYAGGQVSNHSGGGVYTQQLYDINPFGQTGTTGVVPTTTLPPALNYAGSATAQAVNLQLSSPVIASNPATSAASAGVAPNTVTTALPTASLPAWVQASALSEYAEADTNASSYACAGVLSPTLTMTLAATKDACPVSAAGTNAVTLDLSTLPGLGTALSTIADVKLKVNSATAFAMETANGATSSRSASLVNANVTVVLTGGATYGPAAVTFASNAGTDLLVPIVAAVTTLNPTNGPPSGRTVMNPTINALNNNVIPALTLVSNYQAVTASGALQVSAIHAALKNTPSATADLATVTVGPDTATPAPTTTTTVPATTSTAPPVTVAVGVTVLWIRQV